MRASHKLKVIQAYDLYRRGRMSAGQMAALCARLEGIPLPGTECPKSRRSAAARTAALARWSRRNTETPTGHH